MLANAGFEQSLPWWWKVVLVGIAALVIAIYLISIHRQNRYKD